MGRARVRIQSWNHSSRLGCRNLDWFSSTILLDGNINGETTSKTRDRHHGFYHTLVRQKRRLLFGGTS